MLLIKVVLPLLVSNQQFGSSLFYKLCSILKKQVHIFSIYYPHAHHVCELGLRMGMTQKEEDLVICKQVLRKQREGKKKQWFHIT
jgi:hypothetical protein